MPARATASPCFVSGRFDRIVENARDQCKDVALAPFPELERLTR